jgi:hypothetical protein
MIETDQQRRWWFATHPEYSSSKSTRQKRFGSESDSRQARREGGYWLLADLDPVEWRNRDYHYENGRKAASDAIRLWRTYGIPIEVPDPNDKSFFALGFRRELVRQVAEAKKERLKQGLLDLFFGGTKQTQPGEQTPYEAAKQGGRHSGPLRQFEKMTDRQVEKSIRSFEKNIAEHERYLSNPNSKAPEWDSFPPEHQENLKKIWQLHRQNAVELKAIAEEVFRRRLKR